jgi:hypothetical protein
MSGKITMPDYTRVGYVARHTESRNQTDGKIHGAGVPLKRSGSARTTYQAPGCDAGYTDGQKIHNAGIPLKRDTGGTVCSVPKGKMR